MAATSNQNQTPTRSFFLSVKKKDYSMTRNRRLLLWLGLLVAGGSSLLLSLAGSGGKDNAFPSPLESIGYIAGGVISFVALSLLLLEVAFLMAAWFLRNRNQS